MMVTQQRRNRPPFVQGIGTTVMHMAQALFIWSLTCGHTIYRHEAQDQRRQDEYLRDEGLCTRHPMK